MKAMASWITSWLSSLWPFNTHLNDLSASQKLLRPLPLHPSTKRFVFALHDQDHPSSVVYILSTVALSERSAADAREVVRIVSPGAVVAQVGSEALQLIGMEQHVSATTSSVLPTSVIGVVKDSFLNGKNGSKYEGMAGTQVTRVIFGTSFYGHVLAAKEAAKESNSTFYYLESPLKQLNASEGDKLAEGSGKREGSTSATQGLSLALPGVAKLTGLSCAVSGVGAHGVRRRLILHSDLSQLESTLPYAALSLRRSLTARLSAAGISEGSIPVSNVDDGFECPTFALSFYPLLNDLHLIWGDIPGVNVALQSVHKLLTNVDRGRNVDHSEVALSQNFRLAVEGLRVALNAAAHSPLKRDRALSSTVDFADLPYEEKCHVLLAQALKQQARKSETVVAVLDADIVAGIRKHWNTPVPEYVSVLADECLFGEETDDAEHGHASSNNINGKLLGKPVVVVGAGAAAAVGLASFSHLGPVSTAMKILTFKIPTIVKLGLLQTKRSAAVAVAKMVSPMTKVFVPAMKSIAPSKLVLGSKASAVKAVSGTGKIRAAAHGVVASAERASLSAIRTAFYNVMWNRQRKRLGARPWLMFGGSVSACALLLTFGNGIENAIESVPEAPAIAQLGRGLRNLTSAFETLKQTETNQYWEKMYHEFYRQVQHKKH